MQLFGDMVCPTIEDTSSISMDIGCKPHFNYAVLRKLRNFVLKCHPVVEDATCVWRYNDITLGNSKEFATSTHDKQHSFTLFPDLLIVKNSVGGGQFNLPLKTPITCKCYSPTIGKSESRSTGITSLDFQDGK